MGGKEGAITIAFTIHAFTAAAAFMPASAAAAAAIDHQSGDWLWIGTDCAELDNV